MIRVNLLPKELSSRQPGGKRPAKAAGAGGSAIVSFLIMVIAVGSIGGSGYYAWTTYDTHEKAVEKRAGLEKDKKSKRAEADNKQREFTELRAKFDRAIDKARVLLMLDPPDRLLWAEKLNMLADMRPDGIALIDVKLIEEVKLVETPESIRMRQEFDKLEAKAKRGQTKPTAKKVPLISQIFSITGVAYNQQQPKRLEDINNFSQMIESYYVTMDDRAIRRFMDGFILGIEIGDLNDYADYLKSGRTVTQFEFTLKTRAATIQTADEVMKRIMGDSKRREQAAREATSAKARDGVDSSAAATPPPAEPAADEMPKGAERSAGQFAGADIGG
jgi:hypothetical protein